MLGGLSHDPVSQEFIGSFIGCCKERLVLVIGVSCMSGSGSYHQTCGNF